MSRRRTGLKRPPTPGSGPWYWDDYGSTPKQFVDGLRAVLGFGPLAEEHALQQARAAAKVASAPSMPDAH